jgi:hypothetical protein
VLGPNGAPVAAELSLWRDDWQHDRLDLAVDPTTGCFETGQLTPGSFRLMLGSRELTHITVYPVLFAGQSLDLVGPGMGVKVVEGVKVAVGANRVAASASLVA